MWPTIIATLIEVLGPLLVEWLKQWLSAKLTAASQVVSVGAGPAEQAVGALFDEAVAQTPRRAVLRRALLRRVKAAAVARAPQVMAATFSLSPAEAEEIRELATGVAESE